jgi:UDP-N-acetylmuramoylalanine--D-glutamate ligase
MRHLRGGGAKHFENPVRWRVETGSPARRAGRHGIMFDLKNKDVLVIGLGGRGRAACELLSRSGAKVFAVDSADTLDLQTGAAQLRPLGIQVELGASAPPRGEFSLAVVSPAVAANTELLQAVARTQVPMIGELELGFQQSRCLSIAISGTNGKGTTAELVEQVLLHNHRKVVLSGHRARPVCSVVDQTKDLDFLILQVNSFQLEMTQYFRPAVAVLMNLAPDHLDRYASPADYFQANARLFRNQQPFDWAIIQSEALAKLRELNLPVPGKVITFSARDANADLYLDRGLLISRIANWSGPLLDMDHCRLKGPHNAENLMAALAIGHVLRLPLDNIAESLKTHEPGPHRFELVGEWNGVQFINDSKATNVDALQKALQATRPGEAGAANIWLIAGGKDKGLEFHDAGPLLSKRVKHAFLIGESAEKIRAAWSLFTPCTVADSLLEAVIEAARRAVSGDVVLLSPACSSFDQFRDYQERGESFCKIVKSIGRGAQAPDPNINGRIEGR